QIFDFVIVQFSHSLCLSPASTTFHLLTSFLAPRDFLAAISCFPRKSPQQLLNQSLLKMF
ncbi:MAG: hypothetical protein OEW82_08050, partial [Dehalococcoidia bacterium]|nr:hypothetical protein [Dehalococcoidia bacterium]